jgi:hypothetical protein
MCCAPAPRATPSFALPSQDRDRVGGRLREHYRHWRQIGNKAVRRWVRHGVKFDFLDGPPAPRPAFDSAERISDPVRFDATKETVLKYYKIGALEHVPQGEEGQGTYMTFFPVEKKTPGEWRGCLDARPVNEALLHEHFKMEGLGTARQLVRRDDFMTTLDITEAYPHLLISPEHRRYFRFVWEGVHYQYRALCFGVASAPRIFTKLLRPVIQLLRASGTRCVPYLDDILILAASRQECLQRTQAAVNLLVRLGFLISPKSCLDPSQCREFLGMTIDSHRLELRVPRDKIRKFKQVVRQSLRLDDQHRLSLRQLAGVIGKIQAMSPAVSPARLWSRQLLFCKNRALAACANKKTAWNLPVRLSADARTELEQWATLLEKWNGKGFLPPKARHVVTTDASSFGWGGWLGSEDAQGFWTRAEAKRSSNKRELHTTVLVVQAFRRKLAGSTVEIRTDNLTTMAYINHQGGRDSALTELVRPLWDWALQTRTTIFATYIPGKVNDRADRLSRRKRDRTDWMLNKALFGRLSRQLGPFTLDLFATRLNAQVPRYVSRFPDPGATSVDAFRQDLRKERAYANPPFNLITRLLALVKRQRASLTVVLPAWEAQPWWPMLAEMLVAPPIRLPHRLDTFLPGHLGNELPMGAPRWTAIAAKISGAPSSIAAFRTRWREQCLTSGLSKARGMATRLPGAVGSITVPGLGSIPFVDLT